MEQPATLFGRLFGILSQNATRNCSPFVRFHTFAGSTRAFISETFYISPSQGKTGIY
jgi:hypothetical protein